MIRIKSENIQLSDQYGFVPYTFPNVLNHADIVNLLRMMNKNQKTILPGGRVFCNDIQESIRYLSGIDFFQKVLPFSRSYEITGGNFFATSTPYRIHADTGKNENEAPYAIIVIPLHMQGIGRSSLYILEQKWHHQAAFFLHGGDANGYNSDEYNSCIFDYSNVVNTVDTEFDSHVLDEEFPHLNPKNFEKLSILTRLDWQIGSAMVFPRTHLHVTNDFRKTGITSKIGLSLFLSINNQ
jgi:hypothetical protein